MDQLLFVGCFFMSLLFVVLVFLAMFTVIFILCTVLDWERIREEEELKKKLKEKYSCTQKD